MKASDTVMKGREILEIAKGGEMGCSGVPLYLERLVEKQAEISFKAGYNEKAKQCADCTLQNFDRGRRAGIKEVVEAWGAVEAWKVGKE